VIARYEYDGLNRRTKKHLNDDTDDDFDTFQHFFYNTAWQILETRLSESENTGPETLQPEYQHVWSMRYIDAAVLRDKNTDSDDLCDDERLYYTNDANMNVTALVGTDGTALERYVYDPYGKLTIYDDDWSDTRSTSSYDNIILFCGYYYDWKTGWYHVRNRYYHPYFGWVTRDGDYYDGMSLYEYASAAPADFVDPFGLWKKVAGREHTYEAEQGDTTDSLVHMFAPGASPAWQYCLWAECMQNPDSYPMIHKGDRFDASYFEKKWTEEFKGAIPKVGESESDFTYAAASLYGATVYGAAQTMQTPKGEVIAGLANAIKLKSGRGKTPLKRVVLIGHGRSGGHQISRRFDIADLEGVSDWSPSFQNSKNRIGPVYCWFARDAEVRLVSCFGAEGQMQHWASILSPEATVYGTTRFVYASFYQGVRDGESPFPRINVGGLQYFRGQMHRFENDPNNRGWTSMKGTYQ